MQADSLRKTWNISGIRLGDEVGSAAESADLNSAVAAAMASRARVPSPAKKLELPETRTLMANAEVNAAHYSTSSEGTIADDLSEEEEDEDAEELEDDDEISSGRASVVQVGGRVWSTRDFRDHPAVVVDGELVYMLYEEHYRAKLIEISRDIQRRFPAGKKQLRASLLSQKVRQALDNICREKAKVLTGEGCFVLLNARWGRKVDEVIDVLRSIDAFPIALRFKL